MIGDTTQVPLNETVWTQSAPSGRLTFSVYQNHMMVIQTDEYVCMCALCVVSRFWSVKYTPITLTR